MAKKKTATKKVTKMPKDMPGKMPNEMPGPMMGGRHRMPGGMMMADSEMADMMGQKSKKKKKK